MKKIILFDIDGTLIDSNHDFNYSIQVVAQQIQRLAKIDFIFGINSNRAIEDICPYYELLKLNGPIIAENGLIYIDYNSTRSTIYEYDLKLINSYLQSLVADFTKTLNDCKLWIGDTSQYIKDLKNIKSKDLYVLMNKYRKFSASIHVYSNGAPNLRVANQLYKYLINKINHDLHITQPNKAANFIIEYRCSSKSLGIKKLISFSKVKQTTVWMIGDSTADADTISEGINFATINNASKNIKDVADYTSHYDFMHGVSDILSYLEKN